MNLLHITDLGDGTIQVSWQRESAVSRHYPHPHPFADQLEK
jgi:hypothetical protein